MDASQPIDRPAVEDASGESFSGHEPERRSGERSVDRMLHYADIAAAVLLSITTLVTAWCAYQASSWGSVQATAFAEASAARIEATRASTRAFQVLTIDADLFTDWVAAYADGDTNLQQFYETNLMRPEFLPYFEEWQASDPLANPDAMRNPLMNPAYHEELRATSTALDASAEAKFEEATNASQHSGDYILATVLFASVLFFAGISNKFRRLRVQGAFVTMAAVMLVLGIAQIATLPVH